MIEQGKNNIISGIVRSTIRKKLEDMLLDTMSHPENLPNDILEQRELAKDMGFSDLLLGFDEIYREVGERQTIAKIERAKKGIRREEALGLQAYLIDESDRQSRLGKIEPGLNYVAHEHRIRAGRLDILTEDKEGNETKVELKAVDGDPYRHFFQIMKYFNDDKTGKGRVIFIAPKIEPALVMSLAQYQKAGRMKFLETSKVGEEYTFREIKPEDIPEAKPLDWSTRKRNGKKEGFVKVVSARPRKVSKAESEFESFPLYYQVMLTNRPHLTAEQRRKYLQPIEVTAEQKERLDSLVMPQDLGEALENLQNHKQWYNQGVRLHRSLLTQVERDNPNSPTRRVVNQYNSGLMRAQQYSDQMDMMGSGIFSLMMTSGEVENNQSKLLMQAANKGIEELKKVVNRAKHDLVVQKTIEIISRAIQGKQYKGIKISRTGEEASTQNHRHFREVLFSLRRYTGTLMASQLETKILRSRELMTINEDLAIAYFAHNPTQVSSIETIEGNRETPKQLLITPGSYFDFVQRDNELYQSILGNLKVREGEQVKEEVQPVETPQLLIQPARAELPATLAQVRTETPYETLRKSIANGHAENLSPDSKERIRYFAEEDAPRYAPGNLAGLTEAFKQFKLAKKLRRDEDVPSDLQFRNFMDDVTLMLARGSVPSHQDLERLYKESRSEK